MRDEDPPEGVVGMRGYGPGHGPFGTYVEVRYYCDRCDENMLLAWGPACPICGEEMRRYMPNWVQLAN